MLRLISYLVASLVLCLGTIAHAGWHKATTKHFIIYSDQSPSELADYAKRLETFDQAVRYARGTPDYDLSPVNKLTLFAVKDLSEIRKIYGGYGVAGFYANRAGDNVAFVPLETHPDDRTDVSADAVFYHEYAHHLMYESAMSAMPLWLSEGFAEFFSTAKVAPDGSVSLGAPATHRARILTAKLYAPLPLHVMLDGNHKQMKNYYREEFYGRGWLLYHYLTFNTERRGQLDRYIAGIQQGKPALDTAREAFGDLPRLNSELARYVRSTRLPYVVVPGSKFSVSAAVVQPVGAGETAIMNVRMRSRGGVSFAEAPKVANEAARISAIFKDDPMVFACLAEAELDAERYDKAIVAADRALLLQPTNQTAMLMKGRAIIERATERKGPADWVTARNLFLKANRNDPEDPRPLIEYHASFAKAGETPTDDAVKGLLYAFELAPGDSQLRWSVMKEFTRQQRPAEARKILAPLAGAAHGGKDTEAARAVLDKLEAGDLTGAKQLIVDEEKRVKDERAKAKRKAGA